MTCIFFSTPAFSHINSFAPVIAELTKRGDKVYFVTSKKYKKFADQTNSIFVEYPDEFTDVSFASECNDLTLIYEKVLKSYGIMIKFSQDLLSIVRPDCVIHDSMAGFAKIPANKMGIPTINAITTLALNIFVVFINPKVMIWGLKSFLAHPIRAWRLFGLGEQIKKTHRIKNNPLFDIFLSAEKLNIVLTPKEIQPASITFGKTFYFARPTINERIEKTFKARNKKPLIYVALGTTISSEKVINWITETLKGKDADIIIAGTTLNMKYDNITFAKFVNQLEILQKADLFINHGGLNSIYEAIWFKVPQVCIPLCLEQEINAKLVRKHKCGIVCLKLEKESISEAIDRAFDKKVKFNFDISNSFYNAPNTESIIQRIDGFLGVQCG